MTAICDTNVVTELGRREPNPGVRHWAAQTSRIVVSAVTVEEIEYGLAWHPRPHSLAWWRDTLAKRCDVVPIDAEIARQAGELRGRLQAQGKPRTQADMLIAATALVHDLAVVTRNERDFMECGVAVLNPFR
jgi:predicted nucleic acid-binding protein